MGETDTRQTVPTAQVVVLLLGYGLFLCAYCGGPLSLAYLTDVFGSWELVLLGQFVYFVGVGAGCVGVGALARRRGFSPRAVPTVLACAAATVACLVAVWAVATWAPALTALIWMLLLLVGAATAYPLMLWCGFFLSLCRRGGRSGVVFLLAASELVPIGSALCLMPVRGVAGVSVAVLAAVVVAYSLWQAALVRFDVVPVQAAEKPVEQRYRLTAYSRTILVCFGVTWGLACGICTYSNVTGLPGASLAGLFVAGAAACVVVACVVRRFTGESVRFGGFIRFSLAAVGIALVLTPVLRESLPELFHMLCEVVFLVGEIVLVLFTVDVCAENGLGVAAVLPRNQAVFTAAACAGGLLFWLCQVVVGGQTGWELVGVLAAVAVMVSIPLLPSRTSDAVTFTLETLPEDEGYDARVAARRTRFAARYGLAEREIEVLEYLLQGMTRQQIAQQLGLSPWTIKDRVAGIYEKTGAHSYKELLRLVDGE